MKTDNTFSVRVASACLVCLIMATGRARAQAAALGGNPFSIRQEQGITWLVTPKGAPFFSLGVCCVNQGASRDEFNPDNPAYAGWRHYADSNRWAEETLKRLKSWRFTTIGGWSDFAVLKQCPDSDVAFAPVLHIGSTAGAPWWDMWDPKIIERMEEVAREQITALRDDPRIIGYYSDNEIGWWNAILFRMTLEQASTSGQRRRLITLLREAYGNEWPALLRDFEPAPGVENWQGLEQHGLLFLRPGGNGLRAERRFLGVVAERYYSLVRDIIRKYDRRALILGDRYQSFYYPEVARACAQYVDAVSTNLNVSWNDGTLPRFYLDTLHALTAKPVLIGEFYMAARENRSGNKNVHGIYPVAATQKERAAGFRNTLQALATTPYVIGADWFQYYDQPTHGRYDGENFNFGLVDIHDQPYDALVAAASALDVDALRRQPIAARSDASHGVPRAPPEPFSEFKPTLALKHWNRERGFVKPASEFPMADLYVCWNDTSVYLGLYAQDVVEDVFYKDKIVRLSDRAEWVVSPEGSAAPVRARIGGGYEPIVNGPAVRVENASGLNGQFRNFASMELPAKLFGKDRLKKADTIAFSSIFTTHGGGYRVEWKGSFILSGEGGETRAVKVSPRDGATGVGVQTLVEIHFSNGLQHKTITPDTIRLLGPDGRPVDARLGSDIEADVVNIQLNEQLKTETTYTVEVNRKLVDKVGTPVVPFRSSFTTGANVPSPVDREGFQFTKTKVNEESGPTAIAVGPDGHIYAATYGGDFYRLQINPESGLSMEKEKLLTLTGKRKILGLAFDPGATASNLVAWITHDERKAENLDVGTFSGIVSRLVIPAAGEGEAATETPIVAGLPSGWHPLNGCTFGPDKRLYVSVGSMNRLGHDPVRPETPLSAAVVVADVRNPNFNGGRLPLNVQTTAPVGYDPHATNAPLKLYATGFREMYRPCWHSNGNLYGGVNQNDGTGRADTPACPGVPSLRSVFPDEALVRIVDGGYYGHPNPSRNQFVLLGGNPTAKTDSWEVPEYPVGVQPDPAFNPDNLIFNLKTINGTSADGCTEYTLSGPLRGRLVVCFFEGTHTIHTFAFNAGGTVVTDHRPLLDENGESLRFTQPIDVTVHPTGRIYVADFGEWSSFGGGGAIWVLNPVSP